MRGRNIERVEIVILGLDLGAVQDGEPERAEQFLDFALDLRDGVQVAAPRRRRRKREIQLLSWSVEVTSPNTAPFRYRPLSRLLRNKTDSEVVSGF